jgi:phosphoglycerate dehydrogenase-like enzyme
MPKRTVDTIIIAFDLFLNAAALDEDIMNRIQKAAPDAAVETIPDQDEWNRRKTELGPKAEVCFGFNPAKWFDDMPNLKWAQQGGAGANWLADAPTFAGSDVILTNASGVHAIPIAEHVLSLMFALSRALPLHIRSQVQGKWNRGGRAVEIDGATMGVIGVGAIGEKTAEKAKGLNMTVLGLRRNQSRSSHFVDRMYGPEGLEELLAQSDWVVITAALTPETRGMIDEAALKSMKKTAHIINIARGGIIREAVLTRALQEHWIAGAGLDVFEIEPLQETSPL